MIKRDYSIPTKAIVSLRYLALTQKDKFFCLILFVFADYILSKGNDVLPGSDWTKPPLGLMTSAIFFIMGEVFLFLKKEFFGYELFVCCFWRNAWSCCQIFLCFRFGRQKHLFSFSTFVVNVLGCFLIGGLSEFFALKAQLPQEARIFLITGFLGAFTTFSTFGLDAVGLINKFAFLHMLVYVSSSVVLGICSIYAAGFVVRRLFL